MHLFLSIENFEIFVLPRSLKTLTFIYTLPPLILIIVINIQVFYFILKKYTEEIL